MRIDKDIIWHPCTMVYDSVRTGVAAWKGEMEVENLVSVAFAARSTGKHSRTLRYWISNGKLPATRGKRGMLVNLDDVRRIATLTGNGNGNGNGMPISTADLSMSTSIEHSTFPSTSSYMESRISLIVHETIKPFIEELGNVREELGQVKAEREMFRERIVELEMALNTSQTSLEPSEDTKGGSEQESSVTESPSPYKVIQPPNQGFMERLRRIFLGQRAE